MNEIVHSTPAGVAVELTADAPLISVESDALRVMEKLYEFDAHRVILHQENIVPEFFTLRTGLAGAVLQKFVTYQVPIAIVGDFTHVASDSLRAFIYESNQGSHVFFVASVEEALEKLSQTSG